MELNVFEFDDCYLLLKAAFTGKARRGDAAKFTRASGTSPSYFSRALKGEVHLTPDQAAALCEFWALDARAAAYFLNLVHLSRAATPRLKKLLQRELAAAREERGRLSKQLQLPRFPQEKEVLFYSRWLPLAVLCLLRTKQYRNEKAIAQRLQRPIEDVQGTLALLEKLELAECRLGKWASTAGSWFHLTDSPMVSVQHRNWRVRIAEKLNFPDADSLHYTNICALSRRDFLRIREILKESLLKIGDIMGPSEDEEAYCLLVDWTKL